MLEKRFQEDCPIDLRILVLTDGQNNSGAEPSAALEAANRVGAVVDAIIVGDNPDGNLRKIVNATEDECYQINNLGEGFELLEAEAVVSLRARRGGAEKPPFKPRPRGINDFDSISAKGITRGTAVQRAPALDTSLSQKAVVDVAFVHEDMGKNSVVSGASTKRILMELKKIASGDESLEGVHIFPSPDSINFWRVLIEGPQDSPFDGGVFALTVVIPDGYPLKPPQITFETPVYHCNVNDSGKICLGILQNNWSPSLSVSRCLEAVRLLLKDPDTDGALRQWIADLTLAHQKSNGTDTRYYDEARKCTRQEASMTVVEWRQKWNTQ